MVVQTSINYLTIKLPDAVKQQNKLSKLKPTHPVVLMTAQIKTLITTNFFNNFLKDYFVGKKEIVMILVHKEKKKYRSLIRHAFLTFMTPTAPKSEFFIGYVLI